MPALTIDRFEFGLDRRKGKSASDANRLRVLTNAYVTSGRQIKKRPCLSVLTTLSAGTTGLVAGKGKLHTFYGGTGSIAHANTLFEATRVMHPGTTSLAVSKVHFGDVYEGYMYAIIEYTDGTVWHHWINDPGAWATATVYATGAFRRPTVVNGFIYEATTGGTSHATNEPSWPTVPGNTVVDNTVTWTCRTYAILDTNNPRSIAAVKAADKIFAIGSEVVRFCVTGNPRNWTLAADAGFLPVGRNAPGTVDPTGLGFFQNNLAVYFTDALQLWDIDADPALNALTQVIPNIGTRYPRSILTVGQDQFFLTDSGFRSVGIISDTGNFQDADVGNAIDDLVQAQLLVSDTPKAVWFNNLGQAWFIFATHAWVYTFSRSGKISAWSRYEFPFAIDAAAVYSGTLYLRAGDVIYTLSVGAYQDNTTPPLVTIEFPYLDFKAPGALKMIIGVDAAMTGSAQLQFRYDVNDESFITSAITLTGDTRGGLMQPVELCATSLAPVITHQANEDFGLDSLTIYYELLGPV